MGDRMYGREVGSAERRHHVVGWRVMLINTRVH
jgi:hypothetical protein